MGDSLYRTTGEYVPDKLIADNKIPVITKGIRILAGQGYLKRGTMLGPSGSGGYVVTGAELVLQDGDTSAGTVGTPEEGEPSAAARNAQTLAGCDCILAEDADTTDTDVVAAAYVTGMFNRDALYLAEGAEVDTYETELRKLGIFLRTVQEY